MSAGAIGRRTAAAAAVCVYLGYVVYDPDVITSFLCAISAVGSL